MASAATRTRTTPTGRPPSHRNDQAHRSFLLRWAGGVLVALALVLAFLTLRATADDDAVPPLTPPSSLGTPASTGSPTGSSGSPTSSPRDRASHRPTATYRPGRQPTSISAPGIDVRAAVVPIASVGHTLTPPSDVREVGWWSGGAKAGSTVGSVLLTGHTVHTGGGVFNDLSKLRTGEKVTVGTGDRSVTYRVSAVRYLTKSALATAAPHLFDPAGPPRLVLVTCESWDGAEYDGNTVVVATPV